MVQHIIKTVIIQMIVFILIQGPLYKALKINGEFRESVGPLIQQICYVVANDGNVNEEELEFINNIENSYVFTRAINASYSIYSCTNSIWNEVYI